MDFDEYDRKFERAQRQVGSFIIYREWLTHKGWVGEVETVTGVTPGPDGEPWLTKTRQL